MLHKIASKLVKPFLLAFSSFFLLLSVWHFDQEDVIVAVLDTGVDETHPMLRGNVKQGFDFIDFDVKSDDPVGHGTHVAGIITRNAPEAKILSIRVISDDDQVRNTHMAILYAVFKGADIINMSYAEPYNVLTDLAIRFAQSKGVLFIASSGNRGVNDIFYPAKYKGVVSISSWDPGKEKVFGNYGEKVDFLAPGVRIHSAAPAGGYAVKTGTSMSAAYVSGAAAFLKTHLTETDSPDILQYLNQFAVSVTDTREEDVDTESILYKNIDILNLQTALDINLDFAVAYPKSRMTNFSLE